MTAAVAVAAIAGCGSSANVSDDEPAGPKQTTIESAVGDCQLWKNMWVTVGDNGRTLVVDGEDDTGLGGLGYKKIACLLAGLEVSDATLARMENTTSLMGQQSARDGDLRVRWTYHPDNGLDMVINVRRGVQS